MQLKLYIQKLNYVIYLLEILTRSISKEQIKDSSTSLESTLKIEGQYFTSKEACYFLKCSYTTLCEISKRGEIDTYGCGVNMCFKKSDILSFLIKQ
ncbi:helix-turn-helix domain-containing protein [Winogradskyella helgolandensis]|uniref:helix-turn-helix domain-containing protein n=1 Tax=Winogradskyella helgolandensis TaxID=2697010 RepID=UPI0015C6B7F8|nr:helix-turn-helix domain-containing protein [Winogradskyella helgolandensis]